jgi:hypothetical protein
VNLHLFNDKMLMRKTLYNRLFLILLPGILICSFSFSSIAQGTLVTTNTNLNVASGTTYVETGKLNMENNGSVNNSGTVILKGNLVNQNTSQSNLGTGTFIFSGTTLQTISGQNIMTNVTVNNSAGLSIGGNTEIDGALTLTSGLVTLGSSNLLLGPSATVSGTPSASNMIVASGSGQLQKNFTAIGTFTFPVGDAVPHYSPVTLNFTTASFGTGAYAGVNLVASAYPGMTGDYLNRYWNVTQNNISSFNANAQFNYVSSDVSGNEANIYCVKMAPVLATYNAANASSHYLTANGVGSFGTFTGGNQVWQGNFYVFLEGPYNTGTNSMATTLDAGNYIPANQPYNFSPINYNGTESHTIPLPTGVVDWVYIELRHAATPGAAGPTTWFAKAAAFLKSDGTLVDYSDGVSPVKFHKTQGSPGTDNIYPVIRHRNHVAIIADGNGLGTGTGATKNADGTYTYDFRTGIGQALGNANGYKQINTSPVEFGMVAADIDQDGAVFVPDFNIWALQLGNGPGYFSADVDFDGYVFVPDFNKWALNLGTNNPVNMPLVPLYHSFVPKE